MNPFLNHDRYYSAKFIPFDQGEILDVNNPGVCFSLLLAWMKDFTSNQSSKFWKNIKNIDFVTKVIADQEKLSLPSLVGTHFYIVLTKLVKDYGLGLEREPLMATTVLAKDLSSLNKIKDGNSAQLIFLTQELLSASGHIIGIASRKTHGGLFEVGIFDANYGELLFSYDSFVDVEAKTANEVNHYQDTKDVITIHTYEDALKDLLTYYKEPKEEQLKKEEHRQYCCFKLHHFKYNSSKEDTLSIDPKFNSKDKENTSADNSFKMFDPWKKQEKIAQPKAIQPKAMEPELTTTTSVTQQQASTTTAANPSGTTTNPLMKFR